MSIKIRYTDELEHVGVKMLVFGVAGAGKTYLTRTLENPFVVSAEAGLLSLRKLHVPFHAIKTIKDLEEIFAWLESSDEARSFDVVIDSLTEIAEVLLTAEKAVAKDPRQAYGAMQDRITQAIRAFRDLEGRNVVMTAKAEKAADDLGRISWSPSMPGNKTGQALPYFFDEVLAIREEKSDTGTMVRALQTRTDGIWIAKDRSGALDAWEPPDLGHVIKKIKGAL